MSKIIKLMRLLTGEEIIAEVVSDGDTFVRIKNPIRVIVLPSDNPNSRTPQVAFAPWVEFSEDRELTLDKSHILLTMTPISQFQMQYQKAFSNLLLPEEPGKLILPS